MMSLNHLREKCGVFGVFNHPLAADLAYYGLRALQHRGQDSAGIVTSDGERFYFHKGEGLVANVFHRETLEKLRGRMAIGHVRNGGSTESAAQPLVFQYREGNLAVAHNGYLVNAAYERELLQQQGSIFQTATDTEVIAHLLARSAQFRFREAAPETLKKIQGSFALLLMTEKKMFIALDRHGLRPLSLGKMNDAIIVASETCALNAVDAVYWRDVEPGEWLLIDENGIQSGNFAQAEQRALCSFEMIYFARADSRINGKSVLATRKELGRALAREHPAEVDMVVAAPESSVPAALGYAQQLNIPYELGLIRNPYVGRTFIEPTAELRELAARLKLSAAQDVIEGKRVALVDDSIVRGGTSKRIVRLLRDAGAKEVHVRISSPKVVKPCYYGINISDREELLANKLKEERAMAQWMGADSLAFLSEQGLARALAMGETDGSHHCFACFNGVYPTELHEK